MIKYGIIGAGWRSEFYLRIAELLPEKFNVSGIYIRNPEKQKEFAKKYKAVIFDNLEALLKTDFDFIVSCVNRDNINSTITELCEKGIPVLSETPIMSIDDLKPEYKVQIAEQFHFMPRNMAIKNIIDSGILGKVNQVQLSCCHEYHAASLIRFFLDTKDEMPKIQTIKLADRVTRYNSRQGFIEPKLLDAEQTIKIFKFKNKSAVYDFNFEQYFSDIRSSRIVIRGSLGEIVNDKCTYLKNGTPHSFKLTRNAHGINENLDGFSLLSITGNGKVLYESPFKNARLSDEDIAIATCLVKMWEYLKTDIEFYSVKSAMLDYTFFN